MSEPTELLPSDYAIDCLLQSMANGAFTEKDLRNEASLILHRLKGHRANRWSAFSDEELREIDRFIEHSRIYDTKTSVEDEIEIELTRRAAAKQEENVSEIHINVDHPIKEAVMTMVAEYNDGRKDDYLCMRYAPEITDTLDRIFLGCRRYLNDINNHRDPAPTKQASVEMCEKVLHLVMDLNNKIYKETGDRLLQSPP